MPASRDSSLLFSLKELEGLERERVEEERALRDAARDAERRAFEDAERRAREAAASKFEADERRRRDEEAARRDELARHAAMERAAVERARTEVEARARHEATVAQAAHEETLARLRGEAARRFQRFFLIACGLATVASLSVVGVVSLQIHQSAALDRAREEVAMRERERYETLSRALDASHKDLLELERRLRAAERATPSAAPEPLPSAPPVPHGPAYPTHPTRPARPTTGKPCTSDGDPLNGCLK
ncbi:MAG TPA: hypothetical protein VHE30_13810 [Polyangiaceae bacterium]|nr:hypothetical protein [Polyangiaceae bacterium]